MSDESRSRSDDATEVGPEQGAAPSGSVAAEYTEFRSSTRTAGFEQARELAQKAGSDRGRLLKKRFVLEDVLGEGGMGLVYKARDLRKVEAEDRNPHVAVKVLGQGFREHPQAFVALQQEAVKSQKLAHPNIVTVYDFDRDGDTIFMTMELLKGDPLDALLRLEAPFSKEVALRYFRDLCAGLEYAHQRGLIHSDFKPGNIFITTGGTVKILDFGIARAASARVLTHDYDAGSLGALTPAYATAEMVRGEPPSPSDDIYALACVLYVMLTGEHPYQRKSAAEAGEAGLRPSRPACLNNREWAALSAALSTDRGKRPASIVAFRDSLLPQRRGGSLLALAAAALVVLTVGGWYGFAQYQAEEDERLAMQQRLQTGKDCYIQRDYACAEENALVVGNLDPDNREAAALLAAARMALEQAEQEALTGERLRAARACLERADYECARRRLLSLLEQVPDQLEAQQLLRDTEEAERQARVAALLDNARVCVERGELECARDHLASAQAAGAAAAALYPLQRELDQLVEKQMAAARDRDERLRLLAEEARACLQREDFSCAEERAGQILAQQSGSPAALELQQAVRAGREQRAFREQTVAGFLSEARDCYSRKNYSCAIAKSESALAIVPGHADARGMIEQANEAQRQAKMNITIE